MSEVRNAIIAGTFLGIEDHGAFTFILILDYGSSSQGFGHYTLKGEFGIAALRGVLETVGVDSWEKLEGRYVRACLTHVQVERIGHILEPRWLDLATLEKEHDPA